MQLNSIRYFTSNIPQHDVGNYPGCILAVFTGVGRLQVPSAKWLAAIIGKLPNLRIACNRTDSLELVLIEMRATRRGTGRRLRMQRDALRQVLVPQPDSLDQSSGIQVSRSLSSRISCGKVTDIVVHHCDVRIDEGPPYYPSSNSKRQRGPYRPCIEVITLASSKPFRAQTRPHLYTPRTQGVRTTRFRQRRFGGYRSDQSLIPTLHAYLGLRMRNPHAARYHILGQGPYLNPILTRKTGVCTVGCPLELHNLY